MLLVGRPPVLDDPRRGPSDDGVVGHDAGAYDRVRRHDAAATDQGAAKHGRLHAEPAVRPDPYRRLRHTLVLDRPGQIGGDVVEVADVHPVRDQRGGADLDVEQAVDRVVAAEDHLVADPQGALVGAQLRAIAEVDEAAQDDSAPAAPGVDLDLTAEEAEALGDDVRPPDPEEEEPPVADQVVRRPRPVAHDPLERRPGHEPGLPRVSRTPEHVREPNGGRPCSSAPTSLTSASVPTRPLRPTCDGAVRQVDPSLRTCCWSRPAPTHNKCARPRANGRARGGAWWR